MIVECEQCHTKFRLDDKLLKETGSKVRCSVCSHKFIVFAPKAEKEVSEQLATEPQKESIKEEPASDFDKTLLADVIEGVGKAPSEKVMVEDVDDTLVEKGPQEDEVEPVSFEDISQIDSGIIRAEAPDIGKAMERATKVEEEIIAREEREKEEVGEEEEPVFPRPVIKKKRRPGLLVSILLLILLVVAGASALVFFMPDLLPESIPFLKRPAKEQALDMGTKRLAFRNLEGFFVDSSTAGRLFVVKGSVSNNYPGKRSFIRLKTNILDSAGKIAKSKIVYAGNPISNRDLQTLSMEEVNKRLMNRAGRNNININIPPNASIPFMFVLENLPEDVSEFTVEAISSSPAKR
ncbi:MAG: zinc-ribbon domain-containing protein [Deltaproteobacteria bacterium]|nr:zinc-ribbon domain-containing protein [Deltaproteobacteria bacterium]